VLHGLEGGVDLGADELKKGKGGKCNEIKKKE